MVQAAVFVEPGKLELREFPLPDVSEDSIRLRVTRAGLCGTDIHVFAGHLKVPFPIIAGHEIVGVVEAIGRRALEGMTVMGGELKEGDRVALAPSGAPCGKCYYCLNYPHRTPLCPNRKVYGFQNCENPPHLLGGFAGYIYVGANSFIFRLPETIDTDIAALTEPTAVALRAVERALSPGIPAIGEGVGVGRTALVVGVGPIGLLVVACLKHVGVHRIIAVDTNPKRLSLATQMGADVLIDGSVLDRAARREAVLAETEGVGANVVFECAGLPQAFEEALEFACRGGIVIEVGHFTDSGTATVSPYLICRGDLDVRGMSGYPWFQFRDAIRLLNSIKISLNPLITHRVKLDGLEAALADGFKGTMVKALVEP